MKKIIQTPDAPAPIGPYSQAVLINGVLYTSGQIAIDPISNQLMTMDITQETKQVMQNLQAVLKEANMSFDDVIKSTIYITNMNDFISINNVYGSFFDEDIAPARETVQVVKLPKNVHVEISMIATK